VGKYSLGDALMLIFGLDDPRNNGAREGLLYCLDMIEELASLNEEMTSSLSFENSVCQLCANSPKLVYTRPNVG
jgi:hypothetical protein